MTQQQQQTTFNTLSERTVVINNKEFRITVTHNTQKDSYTVGIREYTRTDKYTGYSKYNGVTIPAPDMQTAQVLANTIAHSMQQTGNLWGTI